LLKITDTPAVLLLVQVDVSTAALSNGRSTVTVGVHVWWPAMSDTTMVAAGLPAALRVRNKLLLITIYCLRAPRCVLGGMHS
jgi:hypothetical protein